MIIYRLQQLFIPAGNEPSGHVYMSFWYARMDSYKAPAGDSLLLLSKSSNVKIRLKYWVHCFRLFSIFLEPYLWKTLLLRWKVLTVQGKTQQFIILLINTPIRQQYIKGLERAVLQTSRFQVDLCADVISFKYLYIWLSAIETYININLF